jgi:hypothetical protein
MFIQAGMVEIINNNFDGLSYVSKINTDADIVQFQTLYKYLYNPVMPMHLGAVALITGQGMSGGKLGFYANFKNSGQVPSLITG